jgi:hypothetical protein
MWATLALTTVLNLAPAQEGGLELKNQRLTYGVLGPARKDATVLPGDILWLAFDIEGMQIDKDDRIKYSMGTELKNKKGESMFKKEPQELEVVNTLGGSHIPAHANISVGLDTMPGEYTFTITVTDHNAAKKPSKTLTQTFEVLPIKFGMVRLGFSYTYPQPDGQPAPAPPQGTAGQFYLLNFTLVGWEFNEKTMNPNVLAEIQIVDESGKPTLSKPIPGLVQNIRDEFKKVKVIPMTFPLNLNRAGKFKVQITATDKVTNKKVEQELNLSVVEPR